MDEAGGMIAPNYIVAKFDIRQDKYIVQLIKKNTVDEICIQNVQMCATFLIQRKLNSIFGKSTILLQDKFTQLPTISLENILYLTLIRGHFGHLSHHFPYASMLKLFSLAIELIHNWWDNIVEQ